MSLKDKSWELVQEKVFKAWLNDTLAKRDEALKVGDIYTDVADGKRMAHFLELLSAKKFPYWKAMVLEKPSRIQQIQNNNHVLSFLQKEMAMKNPGCSPEDLVDGKVKYILGLLYTLFRKFRIAVISHQDKSSEEALLLWVKNVTDGYNGVTVDSFKTSFKDGLAFLAMVHRFNPEKTSVKFDEHKKEDFKKNLSVAFDLAEKELGVPKLLDVDEVIDGNVDERSVVLYTSLFFHAFKAADVASDLNKQRQSVEDTLAFEKKRNDELGQTNAMLDERVATLTLELDTANNKNTDLDQLLAADRAKIASLEEKIKQLTHDLQLKEESFLKANQEKLALQSELDELKQKLASEIAKREESEKKAAERQAQDETKIQELKKKTALFEDEIESLKNEVHNFKSQLDTERKDKEEQKKLLEEHSSQDTVHRRGLQVLKRNLDQHIEDLTTWRGYLEAKDKSVFDFETEVRRALEGDLEGKDFVEQLNHLSGKLDGENELMLKLLKQKMADAIEAKKAAAVKK